MERKKLRKILLDYGYTEDSVKKILQGRMVPTLRKALELQKLHGVPVEAFEDIPSFVRPQAKQRRSRSVCSNDPKSSDKQSTPAGQEHHDSAARTGTDA